MKLYFQNKTKLKFKPEIFKNLAASVFKKLHISDKIELGLILTDNREIKKLNQKYRGINKPTDVLSFPIDTAKKETDEYLILGDIVISTEMAEKENEKIAELFKHGLLHLLGFDHEKNKKEWQEAELKIDNCPDAPPKARMRDPDIRQGRIVGNN